MSKSLTKINYDKPQRISFDTVSYILDFCQANSEFYKIIMESHQKTELFDYGKISKLKTDMYGEKLKHLLGIPTNDSDDIVLFLFENDELVSIFKKDTSESITRQFFVQGMIDDNILKIITYYHK